MIHRCKRCNASAVKSPNDFTRKFACGSTESHGFWTHPSTCTERPREESGTKRFRVTGCSDCPMHYVVSTPLGLNLFGLCQFYDRPVELGFSDIKDDGTFQPEWCKVKRVQAWEHDED